MRYRRLRIDGGTYFFTLVTFDRQPLFKKPEIASMLYQAINHVRRRHDFDLAAHVILPDHVHFLMTLPPGDCDFSTRLMLIKSRFTRHHLADLAQTGGYRRGSRRERTVWQARFWEHLVRDLTEFEACADYIHYNPVAHGLVDAPGDWLESSFRQWVADGRRDALWGTDEIPKLPKVDGDQWALS